VFNNKLHHQEWAFCTWILAALVFGFLQPLSSVILLLSCFALV
jgi:hypothetical protein